jgi:hypothetical protein
VALSCGNYYSVILLPSTEKRKDDRDLAQPAFLRQCFLLRLAGSTAIPVLARMLIPLMSCILMPLLAHILKARIAGLAC